MTTTGNWLSKLSTIRESFIGSLRGLRQRSIEATPQQAEEYRANNPSIRFICDSPNSDLPKVFFCKEVTTVKVFLVFSSYLFLKSSKYSHVSLKFVFDHRGVERNVFFAGVRSSEEHFLEPEVTFSEPDNAFETIFCGEVDRSPFDLIKMCEHNEVNYLPYDIYSRNCYIWVLEYGKALGCECGEKIVTTIESLRGGQSKCIVRMGDIGYLTDFSSLSAMSSSLSKR